MVVLLNSVPFVETLPLFLFPGKDSNVNMLKVDLKYISIVFLLLSVFPGTFAQPAKYSNEFLTIGVGARGLGMGNAFVASVDDVTSGYWNPAGLTLLNRDIQIGLMHAGFFAGLSKFDYLGVATGLGENHHLALSIIRVGVDDIPNTTQLIDSEGNFDYERISRFSVADYGFLFSYARKTGLNGLSIGGNAKIIHRRVGEFASAWGFGLDAAAHYMKENWRFGLVLRDVTSTFNVWSFNDELLEITIGDSTFNQAPDNYLELTLPTLSAGVAKLFQINEKFTLQGELDLIVTFDGERATPLSSKFASIEPALGLEVGYLGLVFLRMGAGKLQEVPVFDNKTSLTFQPSLGLGIRLNNLFVDYSISSFGQQGIAMYSNIFSIRYIFREKSKV